MTSDFVLPNVTDTAGEVTIVAWHKAVGELVREGEVLLEVMTEKVNVEVESNVNGRILEILRPSESEVHVGDVLARIEIE
jgi:pyruvate/2-oxoglutarate dehydrogenase complex dihydrolipoamide acyltransferase (E2) component